MIEMSGKVENIDTFIEKGSCALYEKNMLVKEKNAIKSIRNPCATAYTFN